MGAFLYHGIRFFLSVDFLLFHGSHKPLGYLSGPGDGCPDHRGPNARIKGVLKLARRPYPALSNDRTPAGPAGQRPWYNPYTHAW